jgi:type IV pilus biogenesis protein CpaD/CtpE
LTAALLIGFGAWTFLSEDASNTAEPLQLAAAAAPEPASPPATGAKPDLTTAATPVEAPPPAEAAAEIPPVDGLKISSQSWRRGGLGSKALVTFTLRNGNDYAVKDIEISCAFNRRDGSHLTDRKRVIHDTVNMKSRKTFARMHVGFVNVNANKAKCSLVTASRL